MRNRLLGAESGDLLRFDRVDRLPVAREAATSSPRGVSIATEIGGSPAVTGLGEHGGQLGQPVDEPRGPLLGHQLTLGVGQSDVVMGFGPVDPPGHFELPVLSMGNLCCSETLATRAVPVCAAELDGSMVARCASCGRVEQRSTTCLSDTREVWHEDSQVHEVCGHEPGAAGPPPPSSCRADLQ